MKVCWERDLGAIRLPESAIQTIDFRRQAAEGAFDHEAVAVVLLEGEYQQQTQDPNYAERPAERAIFGNHREGSVERSHELNATSNGIKTILVCNVSNSL